MTKRIYLAGLASAAIAAMPLAVPPAHAEDPHADHRHCVSTREWRGAWKHDAKGVVLTTGYTRRELEERWDVRGLGFPIEPTMGSADISVGYPRCGFSTTDAWYGAGYEYRSPHHMVATYSHRVTSPIPG